MGPCKRPNLSTQVRDPRDKVFLRFIENGQKLLNLVIKFVYYHGD